MNRDFVHRAAPVISVTEGLGKSGELLGPDL